MDRTLLVGTRKGLYELRDEARVLLPEREITALERGGSGWWAILDGQEVWRSGADGIWQRAAAVETLKANCLLATDFQLLVGASDAHLLRLRGEILDPVQSFQAAPGRQDWYTPWGGPPDVRSMAAEPSGTVYANVHVGGIARSVDGGNSWESTIDIHADVHQAVFDPGSATLLAASARGLAISGDGGRGWRYETEGLHGRYLRAVAVADGIVLVTASTGPRTDRAAVYRKALDSSEPFERCQQGLPDWISDNIDSFCLAAQGSDVAFGISGGSVYTSSDGGLRWGMATGGLPPVRCLAIV